MNEWTFRKRMTVGVAAAVLLLALCDKLTGSQGLAALMQIWGAL